MRAWQLTSYQLPGCLCGRGSERRLPWGGDVQADAVSEASEQYRRELTGYCYRMLASPFDAEDAV